MILAKTLTIKLVENEILWTNFVKGSNLGIKMAIFTKQIYKSTCIAILPYEITSLILLPLFVINLKEMLNILVGTIKSNLDVEDNKKIFQIL